MQVVFSLQWALCLLGLIPICPLWCGLKTKCAPLPAFCPLINLPTTWNTWLGKASLGFIMVWISLCTLLDKYMARTLRNLLLILAFCMHTRLPLPLLLWVSESGMKTKCKAAAIFLFGHLPVLNIWTFLHMRSIGGNIEHQKIGDSVKKYCYQVVRHLVSPLWWAPTDSGEVETEKKTRKFNCRQLCLILRYWLLWWKECIAIILLAPVVAENVIVSTTVGGQCRVSVLKN